MEAALSSCPHSETRVFRTLIHFVGVVDIAHTDWSYVGHVISLGHAIPESADPMEIRRLIISL